ncbi:MAG: hypothetical protein ACLPUO_02090 [Streptosporangiaceae bacterium]|jgi:hypothetical protein
MRYRLMATYRGAPFEAGLGPSDRDVVLFAACPPPEDLRFEPATGHWRKQLRIEEVQALWESRPVGRFRGERCMVLDDLGDRLHIAYLGHDAYRAERLGYWQVDRGVFELITPRDEVTDLIEERRDYDYPSRAGNGPRASADPGTGPRSVTGPQWGPDGEAARTPGGDPVSGPPSGPMPAPAGGALPAAGPGPAARAGRNGSTDGPGTGPMRRPATGPIPRPESGSRAAAGRASADRPGAGTLPPGIVLPGTVPAGTAQQGAVPPATVPPGGILPGSIPPGTGAGPWNGTGPMTRPGSGGDPAPPAASRAGLAPVYGREPEGAGVLLPPAENAPLPLEAAALRAAAAARSAPEQSLGERQAPAGPPGRRRSARRRQPTQRMFAELADQAAIPASSYAIGEEVDGALCLMPAEEGFEVFSAGGGTRHEVRLFADEESAYFYLFGVLAAEAVRTGVLIPQH